MNFLFTARQNIASSELFMLIVEKEKIKYEYIKFADEQKYLYFHGILHLSLS